jgi:hypothetical protein
MARRIALGTGGISASTMFAAPAGPQNRPLVRRFFLHSRALTERAADMCAIMADLLRAPILNDTQQISNLLLEMRNDYHAAILGEGHRFAFSHAAARLCVSRHCEELTHGIAQLRFLEQQTAAPQACAKLAQMLARLHGLIAQQRNALVVITAEDPDRFFTPLAQVVAELPQRSDPAAHEALPQTTLTGCGVEINAAVNYVARAWQIPELTAEETGFMHLAARVLSTGYLWNKIRVQGGAYGGMAQFTGSHPVFGCMSYRDPNISSTLKVFNEAPAELTQGLTDETIEQNIIGTIGRIDTPRSPHEKGFGESVSLLLGHTPAFRQQMRQALLGATPRNVAQLCERIFTQARSTVTVLGSAEALSAASETSAAFTREKLIG